MPKVNQKITNQVKKSEIDRSLRDLDERNRALNSNQIIQNNKLEQTKAQLIKSLFGMLKELGVDPTNLDSIRQFLQMLEEKDPDLAEMFQLGFNGLLGEEEQPATPPPVNVGPPPNGSMPPTGSAPGQDNSGLMGQFGNLSQQMMQPR